MKAVPVSVDDLAANLESVLSSKGAGVHELIQDLASPFKPKVLKRSCEHPALVNGFCIDCYQKIEEEDGYGLNFSYLHMGLRLSHNEIDHLRNVESKKLLSQKKLHLVLDIDNTLLQSFGLEAFSKLGVPKDDDVQEIDGIFVKLRPLVSTFLDRVSTMFEMYLYTLGTRSYAKKMAKILDPQGKYFGHRIISRDESPGLVKTLDLVLGEESCILILDDTEKVWPKHQQNLILMQKYMFRGKKTNETEINTPLSDIFKVLYKIHTAFFDDNIQAMIGCRRDVRELAAMLHSTVLKGCKLYMSNVKDSRVLRLMAKELGATCCEELASSVTHMVSYKKGTKDFNWGVRKKKYLVHPRWIMHAWYRWQRPPDEKYFRIKKSTIVNYCSFL